MYLDKPRSMFEAIRILGHEMDFEPLSIPIPTEARPGSEEKVKILQARLEAGEDLYHPDDAGLLASKEASQILHAFVIQSAKDNRDYNRKNGINSRGFAKANAVKKTLKTNRIRPGRKRA